MIGFNDAITLAQTKLRSKRLIVFITILVPGLLFGILLGGIIAAAGVSESASSFIRAAINNQYLVTVTPVIPNKVMGYDSESYTAITPQLRAQLEVLQSEAITQRKQLAKQYGITFDASTIEPAVTPSPFGAKDATGKPQMVANRDSPAWKLFIASRQKEWVQSAPNTTTKLISFAKNYAYKSVSLSPQATLSYLTTEFLKNGQEDLTKYGKSSSASPSIEDYLMSSARNSGYAFTNQSTIQRFLLPENGRRQQNKTAIPVLITYSEAQAIFGTQLRIPKKPNDIAGQIAWTKSIQDKVNGQTYQSCYRSNEELSLIAQIQQDIAAEQLHATSGSPYAPPSLQYNLPSSTCGSLTIKKDSRTAAAISQAAKQDAYRQALGDYAPPVHQLLTFQVVGLMDAQTPYAAQTTDIRSFTSAILSAQYNTGAFIPTEIYNSLPEDDQHKDILQAAQPDSKIFTDAGVQSAIVAFADSKSAKQFMERYGCAATTSSDQCNKPWIMGIYGTNYLLTDEFSKLANNAVRLVFPAVLVLAAIVIFITMTRLIIDSRRETAVFRAIGAKRVDIAAVYTLYSFIIALRIACFALVLGFGGVLSLNLTYASFATDYARVSFGMATSSLQFNFIGNAWLWILIVIASIIAISFTALILPLARNVQRSPIKDLRDDS